MTWRCFGLLLLLCPLQAFAAPPKPRNTRTLRHHTFPRPVSDDSAFLASQVGFRQGFLYSDNGRVTMFGTRQPLTTVAAVESLDLTVRVVDWLAVSATGTLQAVLAGSEAALYGTPSELAFGLRFGPVLRLFRNETSGTQITLRPYYARSAGAAYDVSHLLPSLVPSVLEEAQDLPTTVSGAFQKARELEQKLLRASQIPIRTSGWGGSIHVAQAITPQLGLQLTYGLSRQRSVLTPFTVDAGRLPQVGVVQYTHNFAAALSFDANAWKVPLAVAYEVSVAAGSFAGDTGRTTGFGPVVFTGPGLYYSGLRSLQIGAHAGLERGSGRLVTPFGTGDRPTAYYMQFAMRAYFDE